MDHSPVYIELQAMIEKNWFVQGLSEFAQQLDQLEKAGQISAQEHQSLLDLYVTQNKKAG